MILIDISSAFHVTTHRLVKEFYDGTKLDLCQYKKEFFKTILLLLDTHINMFKQYGEPIICIDEKSSTTWRKDYYPMYKSSRNKIKKEQPAFSYKEAYDIFDEFLSACIKYSCIKCIAVPKAEADDVILVLGSEFADKEPIVVISPDKDFIQLQLNPNVSQYSWLTRKMIVPEDKGDMETWLLEHVCLGDVTDCVPKITDFQTFKPGVKEYLESKGIMDDPHTFSFRSYDHSEFEQFGGIFENPRFGPSTLRKTIEQFRGLEKWLDSNPIIKNNYERNKRLVLLEGIPSNIKEHIMVEYNKPHNCDVSKFAEVLGLSVTDLPLFMQDKYLNSSDFFTDW